MKTYVTEKEMEEQYEQFLDDTKEEWIKTYWGGTAYKDIDPIAYNCGYSDFEDAQAQEGIIVKDGDYDDEEEEEEEDE